MKRTGIEWTDVTWNPVTGCDRVSPGCDHCYALTTAARMKAMGVPAYQKDGPEATSGPGFGVTLQPDRLRQPLHWTRPRMVFVNSMSDLFHDEIPDEYIAQVFAVMGLSPTHTFQVLTKRHGRLRSLLNSTGFRALVLDAIHEIDRDHERPLVSWPIPNVWLGVTVEDQKWADIRIPALLNTPAAVRFLSAEPLLGPVDLAAWIDTFEMLDDNKVVDVQATSLLDWVIVGGESGREARPMHPDWVRVILAQCSIARIPAFFKQWGEWMPDPDAPREVIDLDGSQIVPMVHVGKKKAGAVIDGRETKQWPVGHERGTA